MMNEYEEQYMQALECFKIIMDNFRSYPLKDIKDILEKEVNKKNGMFKSKRAIALLSNALISLKEMEKLQRKVEKNMQKLEEDSKIAVKQEFPEMYNYLFPSYH